MADPIPVTQAQEPGGASGAEATPPAPAPAPAAAPAAAPEGRYVDAGRFEAVVAQKYEAIRAADELRARALELERQNEELQRRIGAPSAPAAGANGVPPSTNAPAAPLSSAELDRMTTARAQQLRFNEKCNESVVAGRKLHPDFDAKIEQLKTVAPATDANGRPMLPQSFVDAALETGLAHEVLYALGSDTSEADRIMSLAPMAQAVELTRFADRLRSQAGDADAEGVIAQAARVSSVPAPITPRVGVGKGVSVKELPLDSPDLPIEEFMRRRNEEVKRNRETNGRFR